MLARGEGRLTADQLLKDVRASVWAFAAGAEQYDDLTMLAFRRSPADA